MANLDVRNVPRSMIKNNVTFNPQLANISIMFTSQLYKEIVHGRDYDLDGVIGNGGGYVGLFLGFAIWQIPDICFNVFEWFSRKFMHKEESE